MHWLGAPHLHAAPRRTYFQPGATARFVVPITSLLPHAHGSDELAKGLQEGIAWVAGLQRALQVR